MKTVLKTITAFETSDGAIFSSEMAAEKHEMSLSKRSLIEDYLDSDLNAYTGRTQRGMARIAVINWELWKVKNEITSK